MLSRLLREFLFALIHLVVNILVAGQHIYYRFWTKKFNFTKDEAPESDIKMILDHVPTMSKKLNHIVLLADTDNHSMSDLARVVIWSLVAGVPYVSFYDVTGELQENEKFFNEVERRKKGIPGCIKWCNKPDLNGYTNGIQSHTVNIKIFTVDDGKPKIANCIQQIAKEKISIRRNSTEFTAQELDGALSVIYPTIPDPDIVLYTGTLCCTHGLLPWQIRLTEFIQLSIDHSVHIESYINALYKYNKCDQRFGK